jgi:hypothetical protein
MRPVRFTKIAYKDDIPLLRCDGRIGSERFLQHQAVQLHRVEILAADPPNSPFLWWGGNFGVPVILLLAIDHQLPFNLLLQLSELWRR